MDQTFYMGHPKWNKLFESHHLKRIKTVAQVTKISKVQRLETKNVKYITQNKIRQKVCYLCIVACFKC